MKNFIQAPLPFQGQKRNFLKAFKLSLNEFKDREVFVDLFGGSGLLSHTVKSILPNAHVVYNDFDNYAQRIAAIPATNALLAELRDVLKDVPRKSPIKGIYHHRVIDALTRANARGFVDWITISSSLLFSMKYCTSLEGMLKEGMYNKVRMSDYDATGYLKGVEVVSCDYKELFARYSATPGVVFIVDPPYLSTDTSSYNKESYWKLKDYLDVLQVVKGNDYFYFTSNKSQIVELCEWISSVSATANPFQNATKTEFSTTVTHNGGYTDIMCHFKQNSDE
jgi:site-specific DNA-adenine methylase